MNFDGRYSAFKLSSAPPTRNYIPLPGTNDYRYTYEFKLDFPDETDLMQWNNLRVADESELNLDHQFGHFPRIQSLKADVNYKKYDKFLTWVKTRDTVVIYAEPNCRLSNKPVLIGPVRVIYYDYYDLANAMKGLPYLPEEPNSNPPVTII